METTTRLLLPDVIEALRTDPGGLIMLTEELLPADLADLADALEPELADKLIACLPVDIVARTLEACSEESRLALFEPVARESVSRAAAITNEMAADDRADLYALLAPELRTRLLAAVSDEDSRDIRQLLSYPEDSAGALMTTDFVALPATKTAAEAIERVREWAAEMETIYTAYAVDPHGTLLGAVSLRDLVTSPAVRTIDAIMNPNIVAVNVEADQEDAARLIAKYDLLALPVVDRSHRILGIITVDDLMDVVEEEATEDAQRMGAVEPLEAPYAITPVSQILRARAPWLVALFLAVMATKDVLEHYSHIELASATMLMWFVPLIVSTGGNSGSQSATLIIRAMAVGRLDVRDSFRILGREIVIGLLLGLIVAAVGIGRVLVTDTTRSFGMAITMALAITAVVTAGAFVGSSVPMLLRRLGIDPAVSSTPFISSLLDLTGLILFFEIARQFLP